VFEVTVENGKLVAKINGVEKTVEKTTLKKAKTAMHSRITIEIEQLNLINSYLAMLGG